MAQESGQGGLGLSSLLIPNPNTLTSAAAGNTAPGSVPSPNPLVELANFLSRIPCLHTKFQNLPIKAVFCRFGEVYLVLVYAYFDKSKLILEHDL
jgi:hypothetical protein